MSVAASKPRSVLKVGEEIYDGSGGRFIILGLIGKGGMGEVYRAKWWKRGKSEVVAIKTMAAKNADDPKALMRFNLEGEALKAIRHPNVVPVLATGIRDDGMAWMVMPLLRGKTLQEIIDQQGKLPLPWGLVITRSVCRGLGAIHSIAIHRDIKPQNLFVCSNGEVQILDLGASKFLNTGLVQTTTGFQIGTLSYMSPEQIQNQELDERSDLFSLTVVMYQALTGKYPFDFGGGLPGLFETCSRIVDKPHVPPDEVAPWIPRHIVEILNKGLAKDPRQRFRNADELRDVLSAALNQLTADLGGIEPLTTLAATLAPLERASLEPAETMPRTTIPMTPTPAAARYPASPSPMSVLAFAPTDKVPERPEEPELAGTSTGSWARPTMLPEEAEVSRVSGVTIKRPDPESGPPSAPEAVPSAPEVPSPAAPPAPEVPSPAAPPSAASNTAKSVRKRDPYVETLADEITKLPEELRQPFVWSRVHKKSIDELAERLGLPASIVHHRVLIAEAMVKAEMSRHFPSEGSEEPPAVEAQDAEARNVTALGPRGTVKMIESAATLLGRQGKTLEQVMPSAARPRRHVAAVGIALALIMVLSGASAALYQSRFWLLALLGPAESTTGTVAPSTTGTVAPSTTGTVAPSTTGTVAPSTTGTAAPSTTGTAAPSTTGTAAPSSIATVRPPTTAERAPNGLPPYRGEELPRRRYDRADRTDRADPAPRASGRLFGTDP